MTPKSLIEPARHAGAALLRSQSDTRLVDLTRDGNERAFEAIVQRYRRALLRYCSRLLTTARAEDAVQQTFLSAHRVIHAGDAELNLRPWLYRIAYNTSLNLLRQQGFDHDPVSEEIDGVETPPQAFERGERLREVVAAVQDLPERQRSAIVLQALEGCSYEEIARELGVSDGAVRQLLNRARSALRDAAGALTPPGLLTRVAASGAGESSVAERVAQVVTGAGGGALVAKTGAALVVAGALAGGAVTAGLPGSGERHGRDARQTAAGAGSAATPPAAGARREDLALSGGRANGSPAPAHVRRGASSGSGSRSGSEDRHSSEDRGGRHGGGSESSDDGGSRSHRGDDSGGSLGSDDHSGSRDGGSSGSGSDDGGSSGPGSSSADGLADGSFTSGSSSGTDGGSSGSAVAPSDDGIDSSGRDRTGSGSGSDDPAGDPVTH